MSFPLTTRHIPVTVDKSHLITIGEKLYTEKMSFIRELVNNAYDADATEVHVEIMPSTISIRDNGSGMNEEGLRQYFTIGASEKRAQGTSPRFGRTRIGEFGIGKFAALAASKRFEIDTQRDTFRARLIFDKDAWSFHEDWHLNIDILAQDETRGNGTVITLHDVTIPFIPGKVRRYLMERAPIHAQNFSVFMNGERVSDEFLAGRKIPIAVDTPYGPLTGTIVITPDNRRVERLGIGVAVKGILIRHETFGLETSRRVGVSRITGRVNADFLPITSSRDDFIRDAPEFTVCSDAIRKELQKVFQLLRAEGDAKANLQASRVLKAALTKIGRAMKRRHELFPDIPVALGQPTGAEDPSGSEGYDISRAEFLEPHAKLDPAILDRLEKHRKQNRHRGRPQSILGNKSVIRRLQVANVEIAIRLEHLGSEEEESLVSGGVILMNIDHPLYRTYCNNDELLILHIARVITKELALQTGMTDASRAFALQTELLTDALKGKGV